MQPKAQVIQLKSLRLSSNVPRLYSEFTEDEWKALNGLTDAVLARRIAQGWSLVHLLYTPEAYEMTRSDAKKTQDSLRRQIKEIENIIVTRTEVQNG